MKEICFVNFSNKSYINIRNVHQTPYLKKYFEISDIVNFTNFNEINSPSHEENPYFFKPLSILKAKEMGYKVIIYLDSPYTIKCNLQSYIEEIKKNGIYLSEDGWTCGQWANDKSLEYFNISREEALKIQSIQAGLIAFDFRHKIANDFLDLWIECGKKGLFRGKWDNKEKTESLDDRCLGHRHDQTCAELVAYKLGIKPLESANKYLESWKKNDFINQYKHITSTAYSNLITCENSFLMGNYSINNNIDGCIVECGLAAGANFALMMEGSKKSKNYYGFDSFQGIQLGNVKDVEQPGIGKFLHDPTLPEEDLLKSSGITKYSKLQVINNLTKWNLWNENNVFLIEGWIQHSLNPEIIKKIDKIAVLRLDMDMYSPTLFALKKLFPLIQKNGVLIIDDYGLAGAKKACDEYFTEKNLKIDFIEIYGGGGPVYAYII
jgi:hypothetical protein